MLISCTEPEKPLSSMTKPSLVGVDVSHYQGLVEWNLVAKHGVAFAFIKATQGERTVDGQYTQNWQSSKKAGLLRGVYHYFDPSIDALKQANHFITTTNKDFGELPPVVDIEAFEDNNAVDIIHALKIYLTKIEKVAGCRPIIYTTHGFWNSLNSNGFSQYPLWLADYAKQAQLPKGWKKWLFWQFKSQGVVPGINGHVDLSYFSEGKHTLEKLACKNS
jgi:lysozyme